MSAMKPKDSYPDDNPKTVIGITKVPLHLVPPCATHHTAMAFADGAKKYGPYNWREKRVSASVYLSAAKRHLDAWWDGEDLSQDAKVHHLGHVMACCAIILDGMSIGMLNDDRPPKGAASRLQAEYNKEDNDRTITRGPLPPDPIPTSDRQIPLFPVEGRSRQEGDLGRDSGSVHEVRSGAKGIWVSGQGWIDLRDS